MIDPHEHLFPVAGCDFCRARTKAAAQADSSFVECVEDDCQDLGWEHFDWRCWDHATQEERDKFGLDTDDDRRADQR